MQQRYVALIRLFLTYLFQVPYTIDIYLSISISFALYPKSIFAGSSVGIYINLLVKFVVSSLQNNLVLDAQKNGHTEQEYIYIYTSIDNLWGLSGLLLAYGMYVYIK